MATDTKDRFIDVSADLLRRQGYASTGVQQIVHAAKAPLGSLYHHFPGGKEELGAAAIRRSGALYELLIPEIFDPAPDLVSAVRLFFEGAAAHLEESEYQDACPIATVALEVSSTSDTMREACADVFNSWIAAGLPRFTAEGLDEATSRELVIGMIAALEGAFVLARATQTTEALHVAGELCAQATERALDARSAPAGG
ncbi:MAG TPA: TetR/AcrR family transcriptional regulator [Solirubrobacteraceae bacterium]|nr:TetR/AcrR family transcriptional regulator [Solirubrobacteraceae bacterium]